MKCPDCGGNNIRKSHWQRGEPEGPKYFLSAYRCRDCKHRFKRISKSFRFFASFAATVLGTIAFIGAMLATSLYQPAVADRSLADEADNKSVRDTMARAKKGDVEAQYLLGLMMLKGDRTAQDLKGSLEWFSSAAKLNHAGAQYELGMMYRFGRGTLQDYLTAAYWFEKAAHQNLPEAQFQLGTLYKIGQGVKHDPKKAYVWYNLAASKNYDPAIAARDAISTFMSTAEIAEAQALSKTWKPGHKDFLQAAEVSQPFAEKTQ